MRKARWRGVRKGYGWMLGYRQGRSYEIPLPTSLPVRRLSGAQSMMQVYYAGRLSPVVLSVVLGNPTSNRSYVDIFSLISAEGVGIPSTMK